MDFMKWRIQLKEEDEKEKEASSLYHETKNWVEEEKQLITEEKERLKKHWERSREFRIMLQGYSKELSKKEEQLNEEKNRLDLREKEIKKNVLQSAYEERDRMKAELEMTKEYISALRKTEMVVIEWMKRMENKERSVLDEISQESKKTIKNQGEMTGFDFENYVAQLMTANSFSNVIVTQKSGDFGADITAEKDCVKYVVQCKYYQSLVGVEAIQQIYSAKEYYSAHVSVVATNSAFTKAARTLAAQLNVLLWDGEVIMSMEKRLGNENV